MLLLHVSRKRTLKKNQKKNHSKDGFLLRRAIAERGGGDRVSYSPFFFPLFFPLSLISFPPRSSFLVSPPSSPATSKVIRRVVLPSIATQALRWMVGFRDWRARINLGCAPGSFGQATPFRRGSSSLLFSSLLISSRLDPPPCLHIK